MDRPATRERSRPTPAVLLSGDPVNLPREIRDVAWRGETTIVRELLERAAAPEVADAHCVAVKSGPHRTVYRIDLASGTVFLKHFKVPDWQALVRNVLRRTPAEREAQAAQAVAAAGIETTPLAALATTRRGGFFRDSFLLSREIVAATPLDEIVRGHLADQMSKRPGAGARLRGNLARALGRMAGRLHRAGLTHGDLHPANVLVRFVPGGGVELALIDLQRVRQRRFVLPGSARGDLFALYNSFHSRSSRSDRRRFFAAYWEQAAAADSRAVLPSLRRIEGTARLRAAARRVETACSTRLLRVQLENDRKWQRSNRRLIVSEAGCTSARGLAALGKAAIARFRDDPDGLFEDLPVRFWRCRSPHRRAAVIELVVGGRPVGCEVRETVRPVKWRDLLALAGWSESRRAWEMGHALARRGIRTARPVLYLKTRTISTVREILVTEQPEGMMTLATFIAHRLPTWSPAERESWIESASRRLAAQFVRMHRFSLTHARPSAAVVWAGAGVDPNGPVIQIGACQDIVKKRRLRAGDVAAGLAQIEGSLCDTAAIRNTHRLRFLRRYLGSRFSAEWKAAWRAVAKRLPANQRAVVRPAVSVSRQMMRTAFLVVGAVAAALLAAGCHTVERPITLPVRYSIPGDQLYVLSDFKLPKDHELIRELKKLREQVGGTLDLPLKRDPIIVYIFNNEMEYRRYMTANFPTLPFRSAYFVGKSTELAVYTHWGQSVREDLRHEYTHGLLHSALKRVPLWLDEGLAEYFEVPGPRPGGINHEYARHLADLVAKEWRPDLKRLEALDDSGQMKRADYQESWGWVHFLLNSTPDTKQVLVGYLQDLEKQSNPKPISRRLRAAVPEFESRFTSYVSRLTTTQTAAAL